MNDKNEMGLRPTAREFMEGYIAFDGKRLKLYWDGTALYVEHEQVQRMAKVTSLNDVTVSPHGNATIVFE